MGSRTGLARHLTGVWLAPLAGLLVTGLLIFWIANALDAATRLAAISPPTWLAWLEGRSAHETLSNAAEVVAAVLAIAVTVVAIVVELAANRYTHHITQLFVRAPANLGVMGFFVLTTMECLWFSATLPPQSTGDEATSVRVAFAMVMVSGSLLVLLPYFAYVLSFVSPVNVIERIRRRAERDIVRATRGEPQRSKVLDSIEQLEDVALNAMEHRDRTIALVAVEAMSELLWAYGGRRKALPDAWFRVDGELEHDPDFVALDAIALQAIDADRSFFEVKVLRQFLSLFAESLNRVRDVGYTVALCSRRIAVHALEGEPVLFNLCVRFFNSYLRGSISARDVRTAYYVLHQYRIVAEAALESGRNAEPETIAGHLRFYGRLGIQMGIPFLLETVAYDVSLLAEAAYRRDSACQDALLDVLLEIAPHGTPAREVPGGVRRAQIQLATFFLERDDEERAARIRRALQDDSRERLDRLRRELAAETDSQYWEFTDRGINFAWLPPGRRAQLDRLFEAFDHGSPAAVAD